jgi:hypothetical protein
MKILETRIGDKDLIGASSFITPETIIAFIFDHESIKREHTIYTFQFPDGNSKGCYL